MQPPSKIISEPRECLQSSLLVWSVGPVLFAYSLACLSLVLHPYNPVGEYLEAFGVSMTFGVLVWVLRAGTPMAAICGSMICLLITISTMRGGKSLPHSALTPLVLLFLLTFIATRLGKQSRPDLISATEARRGRRASQVIANLGVAALLAPAWHDWTSPHTSSMVYLFPALILAALAEATADTLSSELGQAFGGMPYLLTTLRRAAPGTDGAISVLGTVAGITGATLVTAAGIWAMHLDLRSGSMALAGAITGLFFDSVLGATVERRRWLNNDLVNFLSTAFAAAVTLLLLAI